MVARSAYRRASSRCGVAVGGVPQRRRQQMTREAHTQWQSSNPRQWDVRQWTIGLTNVSRSMLGTAEAIALMRARWQTGLLWKSWTGRGKIDAWQTQTPQRALS